MVRLEAEVKQITHAIRLAAYNAQTTLARGLDGHYAREGDEAYALIREAFTASATEVARRQAALDTPPSPARTGSPTWKTFPNLAAAEGIVAAEIKAAC